MTCAPPPGDMTPRDLTPPPSDPDFLSSAIEVEEERVVITFPAMTSDMLPIASGVNRDCEGLSIFKMERRNSKAERDAGGGGGTQGEVEGGTP